MLNLRISTQKLKYHQSTHKKLHPCHLKILRLMNLQVIWAEGKKVPKGNRSNGKMQQMNSGFTQMHMLADLTSHVIILSKSNLLLLSSKKEQR